MPPAASGPVLTVIRPILIGAFCATAGIGNAAAPAAAAVDCRNLRRSTRTDMSFLPGMCARYRCCGGGAGGPGLSMNVQAARALARKKSVAVHPGGPALRGEVLLRHLPRLVLERRRHRTIPAGEKTRHRDGC